MTQTTCHSDLKKAVENFYKKYDLNISTLDDRHATKLFKDKISYSISVNRKLQQTAENNVINKFKNDTIKCGEELLKLQNKEWYKEIDKSCDILLSLLVGIENIFEIKNIKSEENFKLRSEIAQLKSKL